MKKILLLSVVTSTMIMAGGDIAPVEPMVETPVVMETPSTGGLYLGLGYSLVGHDVDNFNDNHNLGMDFNAVMFQAGYKVNDYFALEGRYWVGLGDADVSINDWTVHNAFDDNEMDAWGIYLKPMYPVTPAFDIYALVGYANITVDNDNFPNAGIDEDGFSWGIGAAYSVTESVAVFVDYVGFYDDTIKQAGKGFGDDFDQDHTADTINFGVTYQF